MNELGHPYTTVLCSVTPLNDSRYSLIYASGSLHMRLKAMPGVYKAANHGGSAHANEPQLLSRRAKFC